MDFLFQKFCNIFPHYLIKKNKITKKIFYFVFCLFRYFLVGPFVINFKKFKFYSYPGNNDYSKYLLTRGDMPDPKEIDMLIKYIYNKNSIFIDCGANAGFYSIPISSSNKRCLTFAFEPSEIEFQKLQNNIKLNSLTNIITEKKAVSNKNKNLIYRESGTYQSSFASGGGHIIKKLKNKKIDYKVKATTIDAYFKNFKIKKNTKIIMKFDLEGHDLKAIYGAKKMIQKYNPLILFEFSKWIIDDPDYKKKYFLSFLKKNNLAILDLNKKKCSVDDLYKKIIKLDKYHNTIGNFFLVKKIKNKIF